ncbi:cytochrome c [Flavobacterium sp. IMCC34852]|uniref:Cytochrome c n=1 Tax=Flavobacterium rivulicola TaxID=2732161 RepID=A0A7Y3VZU8_9FLAO|nr:cytochrome c [Flavobacterium sp. IMCC34852]NNT73185.1 cytochrome c [Flavobacterium sp. IMCC34852]
MKYKVLALAVLATIIYSCASKSSVPTAATPKEEVKAAVTLTAELAEGKSLYENSCARCHSLYKASDFNAEQWKPIVARMAPKARLNEAQGQKIYNYLTMQ